jgi:hypothetical protein
MNGWKDITRNSWSFTEHLVVGQGGGIGNYRTAYAINEAFGSKLNGKISADIKISKQVPGGGGLICRADEFWSFLAFHVAPSTGQKDSTTMRFSLFQEGILIPLLSSKEEVYLDDGFNHFSLDFFSGQVTGKIITSKQTYKISYVIPHRSFPGYVGLVKFYGTGMTAKHIKFEDVTFTREKDESSMTTTFKYDVFISHSSKDKPTIERLIQDLRNAGVSYWVDHEQITFGDRITEKIEDGLSQSKYVLVCLSPNLGKSNWVRAEYGSILNRTLSQQGYSRKVIPLKLDDSNNYDIPPLLADIKTANYYNMDDFDQLLRFLKS